MSDMVVENKYCPACGLVMFHYNMLHNGVPETVSRCQNKHGIPRNDGKINSGSRFVVGKEKYFYGVYNQKKL